jgi:hypothetical protein
VEERRAIGGGAYIAADGIAHVFKVYRVNQSRSVRSDGVIELRGGPIPAQSKIGNGTSFLVDCACAKGRHLSVPSLAMVGPAFSPRQLATVTVGIAVVGVVGGLAAVALRF